MELLYDMLDLPENLQRGLYVCRPITGLAAGIMAAVLCALCWLMWPWLWFFDIESTAVWSEAALAGLTWGSTMPLGDTYTSNLSWFVVGSTFLPSIVEMFTVRFASGGIKAARILVMFFATFDLVTDWPRVSAFVDTYKSLPWLLGFGLKLPLLVLASFGLEMLFIVFGICAFALVMNVRGPVGRRHHAPAGSVDI